MSKVYDIEVFNFQTGEFDLGMVKIHLTYSIGFVKSNRTGNYIVVFCNPAIAPKDKRFRQEIIVLPGAFHRILPGIKRDVFASCTEATPEQLVDLGFII